MCHGDVYAHNVMADAAGTATLLDYGAIACFVTRFASMPTVPARKVSQHGMRACKQEFFLMVPAVQTVLMMCLLVFMCSVQM